MSSDLAECRGALPSLFATFGFAPASSNAIWSSGDVAVCSGVKPAYGRGSHGVWGEENKFGTMRE